MTLLDFSSNFPVRKNQMFSTCTLSLLYQLFLTKYYNHCLTGGMSSISINQKRQKFRESIRTKQKEDFFKKQRMMALQNYSNKTPLDSLLQNLRSEIFIEQTFEELTKIVNGIDYHRDVITLTDYGLLDLLIDYLKREYYTKNVLDVLTFILQKFKPKRHEYDIYERLYNLYILELVLKPIQNPDCPLITAECVHILACYTQAKNDYCEVLLFNYGYRPLMNIFSNAVNQIPNLEEYNYKVANKMFSSILQIMESLIQTIKGTIEVDEQKRQIFDFIVSVLNKGLFLKISLGVFYQGIRAWNRIYPFKYIDQINTIIQQTHSSHPCYNNLLAVIQILGPDRRINYKDLFIQAMKNPRVYYRLTNIILDMLDREVENHIPQGQMGQIFWEKIISNHTDQKISISNLKIIQRLNFNEDFIWRTLTSQIDEKSPRLRKQILDILIRKIIKCEDVVQTEYQVKKYMLDKKLEQLACTSTNNQIQKKSSYLLDYISNQLRDMSSRME